jgi:transposase
MLTGEEDMQAAALRARGWSISAIARHLGRDRKTVRDYLSGKRVPGERQRPQPDPFDVIAGYVAQRLADDAHVWASALYDEVVALGYPLSYQSFTRSLRQRRLRPHCEACAGVKGRDTVEIPHPPGAECQWDWDELPEAPWGGDGHLLLGTLAYSGKFRGAFAESEEQGYLISGIDTVLRALGGTARAWRFDRMATVVDPGSGRLRASFAPVAKHYSVTVVVCPPRRGNRKGSVEKSVHFATQRFWRTMTATTMAGAQVQLERFCEKIADRRPRPAAKLEEMTGPEEATAYLSAHGLGRPTVALLAGFEDLVALPALPYPATVEAPRPVNPHALVSFEGNYYGLPPGFSGQVVTVRHRLGSGAVQVVSAGGVVLVSHGRAVPGAGRVVRDPADKAALEKAVLAQFSTAVPCRRKANRPPSAAARAAAAKVLAAHHDPDVVVDLSAYQRLVDDMATIDNEKATATINKEEAGDER